MPEVKLARVSIRIFGDVHGVGFRYSTWLEARKRKLFGFVRNEPDGSVFILAEDRREVLEKFIEWCKMGPIWARIEKVTVEWGSGTGEFKGFEIQ